MNHAMGRFNTDAKELLMGLGEIIGVVYCMASFLNAIFIGGVPIAGMVGYTMLGRPFGNWLIASGMSATGADVIVGLFVVLFWAVTTIPGFIIMDP